MGSLDITLQDLRPALWSTTRPVSHSASGLCFALALAWQALTLAAVVTGDLNAGDFFALSASQFLGAFLGACLTWIHWLPHFKVGVADLTLCRLQSVYFSSPHIALFHCAGPCLTHRQGPMGRRPPTNIPTDTPTRVISHHTVGSSTRS